MASASPRGLDGNGSFDASEMVGGTAGKPLTVNQAAGTDGLTVNGPAVALDLSRPSVSDLPAQVQVRDRDYVCPSLDDPFSDPEYCPPGLHDSRSSMAHTQRSFFALEESDPGRTTLVFVHGIQGTPRDFKYLVDGFERSRYQPWFCFYPSECPCRSWAHSWPTSSRLVPPPASSP